MKPEDRIYLKQRRQQADRLINHGEFGQAISVYFDIIRRYKTDTSACEKAYVDLGDLHILLMELDLAENYFQLALGYSPAKPHIHYLLGFTYALANRWDKAITEFRFCTHQDPERFEYAYALGWALYQAGDRTAAMACLRGASSMKSSEADVADLGANLFLHEDKAGVMGYARLAVKVAPRSRYYRWALNCLRELHELARVLIPVRV